MSKKPRNTTGKGYYKVKGSEPLQATYSAESVDKDLRELAGDDLTGWLKSYSRASAARKEERTQVSA